MHWQCPCKCVKPKTKPLVGFLIRNINVDGPEAFINDTSAFLWSLQSRLLIFNTNAVAGS